VDLHQLLPEVLAVAQVAQRRRDPVGREHQHLGHLLGLHHRRLDAVEAELVGRLLREVDDVVERAGERVDVRRLGSLRSVSLAVHMAAP
jgi:hypothetical protein